MSGPGQIAGGETDWFTSGPQKKGLQTARHPASARLPNVTNFDHDSTDPVARNTKQRLTADLATHGLGDAVALYFDSAQPFAGRTFDFLGENPPNKIIPDDLLAVTLLDVPWKPLAVRHLLTDQATEVGALLASISPETDLWAEDGGRQLEAAEPLWRRVCSLSGVADTRASKLLARKRPRLIPITDSIVVSAVGTRGRTWLTLRFCFQDDMFRQRVKSLRPKDAEGISLLRIFDVAMWMLYSQSKVAREARREAGLVS